MIIRNDVHLSDILWYRIGGRARFLIDAACPEDVLNAAEFVRERDIEHAIFVVRGANLLFPDEYFDGAVVRLLAPDRSIDSVRPFSAAAPSVHQITGDGAVDDHVLIESYAGETMDNLIQRTFAVGLIGLEWAGGLPGTVGAAVRGNAGAFGAEVADCVYQVDVLDIGGNAFRIQTVAHDELDFSYRGSLLKQARNFVALSVTLCLKHASASDIIRAKQTYHAHIEYRKVHHPLDYPNTGSTFKNVARADEVAKVLAIFPDLAQRETGEWRGKVSMGYLSRRLGFAGFRVGNAVVAERHCNFILNLGDARAADVTAIIHAIQERFEDTFGFRPEPEIEIVRLPGGE